MKSKFSTTWNASVQPRKQRKYLANAPQHIKQKFMAATLSKELRKKYEIRNIEVRKGDTVKIMRGKHTKKQGKVEFVDVAKTRIGVENITQTKTGGEKVQVWVKPSNVMIVELNTDDLKRTKRLRKVEASEKKVETKRADSKVNKEAPLGVPQNSGGKENAHKKK